MLIPLPISGILNILFGPSYRENLFPLGPGISRDKTMDDKLIYIPNDDKQNYSFFILQLLVEKFEY